MQSSLEHRRVFWFPLWAVAGMVGTALAFVALVSLLSDSPFDDQPFDQVVWLKHYNDNDPDNPRGLMADAIKKRLLHEKPTISSVMLLLGDPESMHEANKAGFSFVLSYNLGMWSGFRIDYDTFDIYFDGSNRVSQIRIIQH
jgi:hypothetical protein